MSKKIDLAKSEFRLARTYQEFTQNASASGIVLIFCTIIALAWANSPWWQSYFNLWHTQISIGVGNFSLSMSLHHWINDLLMVIFFFLVGLEIKREILIGELSSMKKALLPILGALGGVIVPALIYVIFNLGTDNLHGWAIPMATDIAFALGVLYLVGDKVPVSLKVFLAALAIADDIAAVVVIAVFYTSTIHLTYLFLSFGFVILMYIANRMKIISPIVYLIIGGFAWFAMLKSGVHATIAGVLTAFAIPTYALIDKEKFVSNSESLWEKFRSKLFKNKSDYLTEEESDSLYNIGLLSEKVQPLLLRLERGIDQYVAFLIMPLFALANAGIHFKGFSFDILTHEVTLGVMLGLFIGKQVGIASFVWLADKFNIAKMQAGVSFKQYYYVAIICGVGFTMSLFVSGLSFGAESPQEIYSKIGILLGSLLSGFIGYFLLKNSLSKKS